MTGEKDEILVKKFLEGDERAFNEIVIRYRKKIYWHARRMLGNHHDADDVTQDVLIQIYKKLKTFKFNSSFYTWVFKITSNRCLNKIKRNKIKRFLSLENDHEKVLSQKDDIAKSYEDKEKLEKLNEILNGIPPKQKEVFLLKRFEELSYKEISEITGKSIGTLKASYHFALKRILEKMKNEE